MLHTENPYTVHHLHHGRQKNGPTWYSQSGANMKDFMFALVQLKTQRENGT